MRFVMPLLALVFSQASLAAPVRITSLNYGGSGCPAGSVSAAVSPDGSALTIMYSSFVSSVNAGQPQDAKDCAVVMKVKKPVLAALVLESADFRGFVGLESGVVAQQKVDVITSYGGPRLLNQQFAFSAWQGPVNENYLLSSVRPVQTQGNLLDCATQIRKDTKLEFRTGVRLQSHSGRQGMVAVDSADGRMKQSYRFRLVNCLGELPFPFPFGR
jgi:hypothetical protein